jgi:hypothetical protein
VLEANIERPSCEWLRAQGCDVFKLGQDGVPDRLVIYAPGRHYWLEFKRPGGTLTAAQKKRIPMMRRRGHKVFVIDTQAEVRSILKTMREKLDAA